MALREENSAFDFTVYNEVSAHIDYDENSAAASVMNEELDLDV